MYNDNYTELLIKDKTSETDVERKALFLIFSTDDLYRKVTHLYDFKEHSIKPESLENGEVDLSSSSRKLVLAAHLIYTMDTTKPIYVIPSLALTTKTST